MTEPIGRFTATGTIGRGLEEAPVLRQGLGLTWLLAAVGAGLMVETVRGLAAGTIEPRPQRRSLVPDAQSALLDFEVVINDYPRSRKVPDALLKMGYCNYSLKRWEAARVTLTRVQADYPETTAARLAGQYLQRMEAEGV